MGQEATGILQNIGYQMSSTPAEPKKKEKEKEKGREGGINEKKKRKEG